MLTESTVEAPSAYEALAEHYDAFTHHEAYPMWIRRLERLARNHGMRGRSALDVGCGTGKSLLPLVELGYSVAGCDPSVEMLARTRQKLGESVPLSRHGLPRLPVLGRFDYITCLNDVLNYVVGHELAGAFGALAANLAVDGVLVFDTSTVALYRSLFARVDCREHDGRLFIWRGGASPEFGPHQTANATIEVLTPVNGLWRRTTIRDVQHHHVEADVVHAVESARLRVEAVYGQYDDGRPELPFVPERHTKAIYVVTKASANPRKKGGKGNAEGHEALRERDSGSRLREDGLAGTAGPAAPARPDQHLRPILRRSRDPRLSRDSHLYVLAGPGKDDLVLEGVPEWLPALLRLADGSRDMRALAHDLQRAGFDPAPIEAAVAALAEAGVLDDGRALDSLTGYDAERYARQLACFADYLGDARSAVAAQRKLLESTVCVLGLGGLGSWAAWALAAAGVGALVGVDADRVELSNLNRQVLYAERDIGRAKAEVAGETLCRFNPRLSYTAIATRLDSPAAVERAIAGADIVLDSLDSPPHVITRWVNQACFAAGISVLSMSQHPPQVRVGPLYAPGETGCFACQEATYRERYPLYGVLEESEQLVTPSATFGPACGIVGTLAANEAVARVGGLHVPRTLGRALIYDLRTGAVEWEEVPCRAACAACDNDRLQELGHGVIQRG